VAELYTSTEPFFLSRIQATIAQRQFTLGAELGVYLGGSLLYLARGFQHGGGGTLYAIDSNEKLLQQAETHMRDRAAVLPDVTFVFRHAQCPDAITDLPDGLQVVFIDDLHDAAHVSRELDLLLPKMAHPGVIFGHDVCNKGIRDAFTTRGATVELVGYGLAELWV